jgi:hypothetical protein
MMIKSKLTVIATVAAISLASPAFAQSFNKGDGTGNELPFAYGPDGAKPAWTVAPQNEQIAVRQSNAGKVAVRQKGQDRFATGGTGDLYNYVPVPSAAGAGPSDRWRQPRRQ